MRPTVLATAGAAAATILSVAVFAGTPQDAQKAQVFTSGVTLVQLDVSALDSKTHRPVRGLTKADFSVSEDGHPQTVAAFSAVDVPDPPAPRIVDGKPVTWLRDVAPDVQSNAAIALPESRLFVLFIDDAMIPGDPWMIRQAKQAGHTAIDKLGPADRMAVVLSMESGSAQDFTSDKARLHAAVEKLKAGYASYYFGWDNGSSGGRITRSVSPLGSATGPGVDNDIQLRDATYSTLFDMADALMAAPERRKTLIYISPGVAVDSSAAAPALASGTTMVNREANVRLAEELPELFRRMQRANVSIYSVDPAGLNGMENFIGNRLAGLSISAPTAREIAHTAQIQMGDFLLEAADNTGGRAIVNTNDLSPGIEQIFLESGAFYLLGYEPPPGDKPGTLHRLKVTVDRQDVEVRTRSGYYTPAPEKPNPKRPAVTASQKAIGGVLPSADVPLRVALAPFAGPSPEAAVAVVLGLDRARSSGPDTIDITTGVFTPDGRDRGVHHQTAQVAARAGQTEGYEALSKLSLPPGRYQLRIAAHSTASNMTGSVFADVDVPDFSKEPLSLSGVLISLDPALPSSPHDAFRGLLPLTPTAERAFASRERATAFLRVYQGGVAPLQSVKLTTLIVNDQNQPVVHETTDLAVDRFHGTPNAADVEFSLPLATLRPGPYLLTFEATAKGLEVRRDVRFQVK